MTTAYKLIGGGSGGTAGVSIAPPSNVAGDFLIGLVATGNEPCATPSGWNVLDSTPGQGTPGAAGAIILQAFWKWADGSNTAMAAADPGDSWYARILSFTGVKIAGNPIDAVSKSSKTVASTSCSIPGVTARQPGIILYISARDADLATAQASGEANASLSNLTERGDAGNGLGNGQGMAMYTGDLAAPGATGTLTATLATSTLEEYMCISLLTEYATKGRKTFSSLGSRAGSRQLQG